MTSEERTQIYQRRDELLAELNYVSDDEEAEELKQQIIAYNQQLADEESDLINNEDNGWEFANYGKAIYKRDIIGP